MRLFPLPTSNSLFLFLFLFLSFLLCSPSHAQEQPVINAPWATDGSVQWVYDDAVSDEFSGKSLDLNKWDEHGIRNIDTGCPTWNGPPSTVSNPDYSTFFPASEHPTKPGKSVRLYKVKKGSLRLRIVRRDLSFFTSREYYCNSTTYTCNHDSSIPCYWTNFFGEPVYKDAEKTQYAGFTHDKCKKSPFCIPHPQHVLNTTQRVYATYAGTHLTGKTLFRYGYIETKVRLAKSSAVFAVWMHGRNSTGPGYCRFRKAEGFANGVRRECPSFVRSERWQEIDLVEAMNSRIHAKRWIPNIHVFAAHKGEYSSSDATDNIDGTMGGGPIIVNNFFNQYSQLFDSVVDESQKVANDFHWNPGKVSDMQNEWSQYDVIAGVYWSKNEIRLYLNGTEVKRIKNTIVHQPMALDISNTLNVGWSEQEPTDKEIKQWGKVDYVRVWSVFTENGEDPPSELELEDDITKKFDARYGNEMYGVLDRFPHNDDVTLLPVEPTKAQSIINSNNNNNSQGGKNAASGTQQENIITAPLVEGVDSELGINAYWKSVQSGARITTRQLEYLQPLDWNLNSTTTTTIRQKKKRKNRNKSNGKNNGRKKNGGANKKKPAGGKQRERLRIEYNKLDSFQRRARISRPDRQQKLGRRGEVQEKPENPGMTAFDDFDANAQYAGFCAKNGDGRGV